MKHLRACDRLKSSEKIALTTPLTAGLLAHKMDWSKHSTEEGNVPTIIISVYYTSNRLKVLMQARSPQLRGKYI